MFLINRPKIQSPHLHLLFDLPHSFLPFIQTYEKKTSYLEKIYVAPVTFSSPGPQEGSWHLWSGPLRGIIPHHPKRPQEERRWSILGGGEWKRPSLNCSYLERTCSWVADPGLADILSGETRVGCHTCVQWRRQNYARLLRALWSRCALERGGQDQHCSQWINHIEGIMHPLQQTEHLFPLLISKTYSPSGQRKALLEWSLHIP